MSVRTPTESDIKTIVELLIQLDIQQLTRADLRTINSKLSEHIAKTNAEQLNSALNLLNELGYMWNGKQWKKQD